MKYELRIGSDDPNELAKVFALLTGVSGATLAVAASPSFPNPASPGTLSPVPGMPPVIGGGDNSDGSDDDDTGPVVQTAPGEVDAAGFPWDERIHAGTRAKTDAGIWRRKRNVADHIIAQVEGELRARGYADPRNAAPTPVAAPTPIPMPIPVAAAPIPPAPVPTPIPVAAAPIPPAPTPIPVPAPAAPTNVLDFGVLMSYVQNGLQRQVIDAGYIAKISAELGVNDLTGIMTDGAKCYLAYQMLARDGKLPPAA